MTGEMLYKHYNVFYDNNSEQFGLHIMTQTWEGKWCFWTRTPQGLQNGRLGVLTPLKLAMGSGLAHYPEDHSEKVIRNKS